VAIAEEKGYDFAWIPDTTAIDEKLFRDPYSLLAICALKTHRIKLGIGVTNPYTRHPAMSAVAMATIDEISGGRAVFGIGASSEPMLSPLGIEGKKPVTACREAIEVIRKLYAREKVQYKGQMMKINGTEMIFDVRKDIPIYLACRGPGTSELAGELADGALIGAIKSRKGLTNIIKQIKMGAEKGGRDLKEIDLVSWVFTSISDDKKAAMNAVKPGVAAVIGTEVSPTVLKTLGVEEKVFGPIKEAFKAGNYDKVFKLLRDELIDDWSLSGTPGECVKKIEELDKLGITQVSILPAAFSGKEREDTIKRFGDEIITQFK
jgi:5,10-methylenetetrahydromethanopterin reductase